MRQQVILTAFFSLVLVFFVSFWTQSDLDFWLTHFAHHAVHVPFWMSFIITLICNAFIVMADIIMSLLRLVIA